jgi:hypothetical protein
MTTLQQLRGLLDGKPDLLRGQVLRVDGEWADVATTNGLQKVRCTLPIKPGDQVSVRQGKCGPGEYASFSRNLVRVGPSWTFASI